MTRSVKQLQETVKRNEKIVQGWDDYNKIALKYANNWFRFYFPTHDDLAQSAALAATIARVAFGEEAVYGELVRNLGRTLRREASAYGMRNRKFYRPDGRRTSKNFQLDEPLTAIFGRMQEEGGEANDQSKADEWFESRMMLLGVGEWTRRQAGLLNF